MDVQLAHLREEAARHHEALFVRPASLHGGLSYVVVRQEPTQGELNVSRSAEVLIYDVSEGRLTKTFDFQPAPYHGEPWRYRLDGFPDLENTGSQEIVGGFSLRIDSGGTRGFVPSVIGWDDASRRYLVEPLLPLSPLPQVTIPHFQRFRGVGGQLWWELERDGATLRDIRSGTAFHGFGGLAYVVRSASSFRAPTTTGLIVVALAGARRGATWPVTALTGWIMNPTLPKVQVSDCPPHQPTVRLVYGDVRAEIARADGRLSEYC